MFFTDLRNEIGRLYQKACVDIAEVYQKIDQLRDVAEVRFYKRKVIRVIKGNKHVYTYSCPHVRYIDKNGKVKYRYMNKAEYARRRNEIEQFLFLRTRADVLEKAIKSYSDLLSVNMNYTDYSVRDRNDISLNLLDARRQREYHNEYFVSYRNDSYLCKDEKGDVYTSRGEMIVGNVIRSCGLVACYELPFFGEKTKCQYLPDFTILNNNNKVLVEFFGMMEDPEYLRRTRVKISEYAKNGYIIGKNLICLCAGGKSDFDVGPLFQVMTHLSVFGKLPTDLVWLDGKEPTHARWQLPDNIKKQILEETSSANKVKYKYLSKYVTKV